MSTVPANSNSGDEYPVSDFTTMRLALMAMQNWSPSPIVRNACLATAAKMLTNAEVPDKTKLMAVRTIQKGEEIALESMKTFIAAAVRLDPEGLERAGGKANKLPDVVDGQVMGGVSIDEMLEQCQTLEEVEVLKRVFAAQQQPKPNA